ncbi:MAG: Pr6Pr family membrane protein [Nocardioides sp.]
MTATSARSWHALTAAVAVFALILQLVLVITGHGTLVEDDQPGLGVRLGRLVSYFTIQSNVLVAVAALTLARDPARDGTGWRVLRLGGLVGITVTGLVHFLLLRPLLDLQGWNAFCDRLLHMVVPLLVVIGWAAFGPRPRVTARVVAWALAWPVAWLAWTLAMGVATGWFPYPFLDVDEEGWGPVLATSAAITALFLALFGLVALLDRRLPRAPGPGQDVIPGSG